MAAEQPETSATVRVTDVRGRLSLIRGLDRIARMPAVDPADASSATHHVVDLRQAEIDLEDEVLVNTLTGGLRYRSEESGVRAVALLVPPVLSEPVQAMVAHHFAGSDIRWAVCDDLDVALGEIEADGQQDCTASA